MADHTQEIADIRATIAESGVVCQLDRDGDLIDVPVVLTQYTKSELGFGADDGEIILTTDRKAIIPGGLERNPLRNVDKLIIPPCDVYPDGDTVGIINAVPVAPDGTALLWELQLRK
jgi:hypothetical protein